MSTNQLDFDKIANAQKKKIIISSRRSSQGLAISKQNKLQNNSKLIGSKAQSSNGSCKLKLNPNDVALTFETQYQKLSEITQRCYQYYQKYHNDQCKDLEKINSNFDFIKKNMEETFSSLSECIEMKKKQLHTYIENRRKDLLSQRIKNQQQLQNNLDRIAETRKIFMKKFQTIKIQKYEISEGLSDLANILNIFYQKIERIENYTIAEALDDTVSFLTNAIEQDIKNFFQEAFVIRQSPNISFNNDHLFEHKKDVLFQTDQAWQTSKSCSVQMINEKRLKKKTQITDAQENRSFSILFYRKKTYDL